MKMLNLQNRIAEKVLVVDDEPDILEIHSRTLKKYGVQVRCAANGLEAWNIFQAETDIPLVITDIDMPVMNGIELIVNINRTRPLTQIIIITGVLDDALALFGIKQNVVCLPKPVEPEFVAIAAAGCSSRYLKQRWEDSLKTATLTKPWDEANIMAILEKAPWL